jgi:hypothetical protein
MRAAAEDLFFVDPVELAVQDERRAIGCERTLVAGEVRDVEVVAADVREKAPVGAELRFLFGPGRR